MEWLMIMQVLTSRVKQHIPHQSRMAIRLLNELTKREQSGCPSLINMDHMPHGPGLKLSEVSYRQTHSTIQIITRSLLQPAARTLRGKRLPHALYPKRVAFHTRT